MGARQSALALAHIREGGRGCTGRPSMGSLECADKHMIVLGCKEIGSPEVLVYHVGQQSDATASAGSGRPSKNG